MTIAEQVRALRTALNESREAFGRRFPASRRTVECWEQGRNRPTPAAQKEVDRLWARYAQKAKSA